MSYKVTATEVSKLRNATGAGMMDSKKALEQANGDFNKAIQILREKGKKIISKRADKISIEGIVLANINCEKNKGTIIALKCETDFVAKNKDFISLAKEISEISLKCSDIDELLNYHIDDISVKQKLNEKAIIVGEKIEIGFFSTIYGTYLNFYNHAGYKISSIVSMSKILDSSDDISKDIAMQIAAMNPISIDEKGINQELINSELNIARSQLKSEGKPENIIESIAQGKLRKFFKENTLINQLYIKDNKLTIKELINKIDNDLYIESFLRHSI